MIAAGDVVRLREGSSMVSVVWRRGARTNSLFATERCNSLCLMCSHASDGDSLCVGPSPNPSTWVEIREARWLAPELHEPGGRQAKAVMDKLVGRSAICTVERGQNGSTRSYDRVVAACAVSGRPIGTIMTQAGIARGGRGASRSPHRVVGR